jgi:hypothetical protein
MKQFSFHMTDFRESLNFEVLLNSLDMIQFGVKIGGKKFDVLHEDPGVSFVRSPVAYVSAEVNMGLPLEQRHGHSVY